MDPFIVGKNALGFTSVRVHYRADPTKDTQHPDPEVAERAQEWFDRQRQAYISEQDWQREQEINFNVGKGARVFPQFSEMYHCKSLTFNTRKVVYRGWDFGWHTPVCLFAQIDPQGRLVIVKEIVGHNQTTHDFASSVVKQTAAWLPLFAAGFEDYVDPAGAQQKSIESEKSERRDIDVLAGLGIHAQYEYGWSKKDGRSLVHRLLSLRGDGTPGFLLDAGGCPLTAQSFLGRYVFPETRDGKIKDEPDDDTHPWADVMAATRYLVTGLHKRLGLMRFQLGQNLKSQRNDNPPYQGYGTPRR